MSEQILISHSSKDNESAKRIKKVLEDNGFSCWLDNENIMPGSDFLSDIANAMKTCEVVVVLVSKNSQASTRVRDEITAARDSNKLVIPYMIQDFELDDTFKMCLGTAQRVSGYGDNEEEALRRVIVALRDYLKESSDGEEIKITIEKKSPKKKKTLYFALGGIAVLAFLLAVLLPKLSGTSKGRKGALEVYYSEVLPYTDAGYYQTYQQGGDVVTNKMDVYKAFSILSFVRNQGDSAAFVEQIGCDILKLEADGTPVLLGDAFLEDARLKFFAYNDGWGDGKNVSYKISIGPYNDIPVFKSLKDAIEKSGKTTVKAESAVLLYECDVPMDDLRAYARNNGINFSIKLNTVTIELSGKDSEYKAEMYIVYDPKKDTVELAYNGRGDGGDYSITLYALLDVDAKPTSLRFTGIESTPLVDNTFRIETVIIPTKSCSLVCRGVYSIGGSVHETEEYSLKVRVPVFIEGVCEYTGKLTRELFHIDMRDEIKLAEILASYRYRPESVLEYSK